MWVYNRFTADDPRALAGRCTFWFKNLKTDEDEGEPEVIYREDAIVPRFDSRVRAQRPGAAVCPPFWSSLSSAMPRSAKSGAEFGRGDPGEGKCWTKAEFFCGKAK